MSDSGAFLNTVAGELPTSAPMRAVDGRAYVDLAAPVFNADGEMMGVLLARVDPATLWAPAIQLEPGSVTEIVDSSGVSLSGSSPPASLAGSRGDDTCSTSDLSFNGRASGWRLRVCPSPPTKPPNHFALQLGIAALVSFGVATLITGLATFVPTHPSRARGRTGTKVCCRCVVKVVSVRDTPGWQPIATRWRNSVGPRATQRRVLASR